MATLPNNEREIDHFLDGIMKPHERILFSARMILNPQLKTHVAVQNELRYQVLMYGAEPFTLNNYFRAGFANNFASSITSDFFIGTTPVPVWMIVEGPRLKMRGLLLYVAFTFIIAFAFTCPLFFFNRQRHLLNQRLGVV